MHPRFASDPSAKMFCPPIAATAAARASDISPPAFRAYPSYAPSAKMFCPLISAALAPESAVAGRLGDAVSRNTPWPLKSRSSFASECFTPGTNGRSGESSKMSWPWRSSAFRAHRRGASRAGPSSKTSWPEISSAFASEIARDDGASFSGRWSYATERRRSGRRRG
jgi:hypothetical protein